MSEWAEGYVSEVEYTSGYYAELNPLRVRFALTLAGLEAGALGTACELGYGQGLSLNLHAAGNAAVDWYGTDFNPAQAAFAQQMAGAAGTTARCVAEEDGFADYCQRQDLPKFDFIGLHGIWSWISDANRQSILDLIRRRLNVGGVVYVSYNTDPGWAAFAPMRALLKQHADVMSAPGDGVVQKMDRAIAFAEQMLGTEPKYALHNPQVKARFDALKSQARSYLVHEYFNGNWEPMRFDQVAGLLQSAKLGFGCSATLLDHVDAVNLLPPQQKFLAGIKDPVFQQTARDYMVNQQFRRDYWVKGQRRMGPVPHWERLREFSVVLCVPAESFEYKVKGSAGSCELQKATYEPILHALADHRPIGLGALFAKLSPHGMSVSAFVQAIVVLAGMNALQPVQAPKAVEAARKSCDALNRFLMERARFAEGVHYLASPVVGGGVPCGRVQQLLLLARQLGAKSEAEMAQMAWKWLSTVGHRMRREGKSVTSPEENLQLMNEEAARLVSRDLPIFKALGLA